MEWLKNEVVSQKCDWVSFTVPFYKNLNWLKEITTQWKEIPKIKMFTDGQENSQGVRLYWNKNRPEMGKHIILSGSTLTNIPIDTLEMLRWIVEEGYKISRIDLCVDVTHSNLNPLNATYHLKRKQAKTHARKAPKWDDSLDVGFTQYIGKKTSETFVRIYDKASEMGTIYRWVRIEVVYSGDRATPAAKTYLQCEDCRALIKAFVDFPRWRKWNKVMECETVKVKVPKKQSNTREWLMTQVTKSLAKEMILDDDQEFYVNFIQRLREEYLKLSEETIDINF